MIVAIQRAIVAGLAIETFDLDEIKKRIEICKLIESEYKKYFTKEQIDIIRLIYHDFKKHNQDGSYLFGLSEISEKMIVRKFPYLEEEIIECLGTGALAIDAIPAYLKELEKEYLKNEF